MALSMWLQVFTLGLTASSLVTADRTTVSIDFGWRYIPDPNGPAHGGNAHGPAVNSTAPPANAKFAQPGFEDSTWAVVDIPHDATVTGDYAPHEDGGEGFLPLARTWYRKKLSIPTAWQGKTVTLIVDGSLSTTTWYFNGKRIMVQNPVGYLPTVLQLDVNPGQTNLLACYVDGGLTTGWWYEGSGLIRHARLVVTSPEAAIEPFGISTPSFAQGGIKPHSDKPRDGLVASTAVMTPSAALVGSKIERGAKVNFTLIAADGLAVASQVVRPNKNGLATAMLTITDAELWSVARPYLYELQVSVIAAQGQEVFDSTSVTTGIRNLNWDTEQGLKVNEQRVKMRGACNHESFTGVGAALPDRVDLLRVQQMRGVGMNAWRTSHNPPEPVLLDLTDRLGVLVLDENRVLATGANCHGPGCRNVPFYNGDPVADMGALAKRDRNHASVAWYSLCNEAGCGNGSLLEGNLVERAKQAAYTFDGSRDVGANMGWRPEVLAPRTPMSDALDVMGMSHSSFDALQTFHETEPDKPLVETECCSCQNQRGEDADQPHSASVHYTSEVAGCLWNQTQRSDKPEYVAGTFVWTLHDYMGEPVTWPHVSSSFGAIDLAGFPKPPAWFYRSIWLSNIPDTDAGRPPLTGTATTIRIVENWAQPKSAQTPSAAAPKTNRTIHCYTNAPLVALELNGKPVGAPMKGGDFGRIPTFSVKFAEGTLTAKALASDGKTVLASHSIHSWGAAAAIKLSMDVPSVATGTGNAVYVDGADVALLRATVVDAAGNPVFDATHNVSFAVTKGPGFIAGVGNGDPSCQEPSHASWRSAYHGLARALVRVTVDASGTNSDRALRASVNLEAGKSVTSRSSTILVDTARAPTSISVTATSPGLKSASFTIPLSVDPKDSVLAVAAASVGTADTGNTD